MIEININTPALLFPAITLLMLAYTNRFLSLGSLVRKLHDEYHRGEKEKNILLQIKIFVRGLTLSAICRAWAC